MASDPGSRPYAALLADRGAVIVDADAIARELQAAGSPVVARLAERFGAEIIGPDGELDRPRLAAIAFADQESLQALNDIVHPAVRAEMQRRVAACVGTDRIVVMDIPLLAEHPRSDLAAVIVVDVPTELQVERLISFRGFDEADARARIAKQATREQRLAIADRVIDNTGDRAALSPQVDAVWKWLIGLPQPEPGDDPAASGEAPSA
ncbi:MAG: dephospho-CoA kinase [Ilumatobacteraceae bacterium]